MPSRTREGVVMELNDEYDLDSEEEMVELPYTTSPVLFDRNYELGREVWYHYDGDTVVFNTRYIVDPILDANVAVCNTTQGQRWGGGQRVASIPLNMFWDKLHEAVTNKDDAYVRKFLNNSDNKKLRTFHGPTGKL